MTMRNPLGSVSSLSLAANPAALPVMMVVAGVAVTVSAAAFTYKAYKNFEEKKHRREMEEVNRLHEKYLARIVIFDLSEIQGFPIIFKFTGDKDSSAAESLHYNDEEVESIGKSLPHGTDLALSTYRESVLNAILKLKEYYFSRKDRHDVTAGVISYLLNMLQTKCLNFEGYEYDIAYLHAISNFINAYASIEGKENSQHFSRLNPVYSYLLTAKQALEKHKEKLSLEEMLGELRDSCIHQNNLLIRNFAKLITKNSNWNLIKTAAHDELMQGILRREYVHTEVKGLVLNKDHQKKVPDSPFREWLMCLSDYYIDTLDPDSKTTSEDIIVPEKTFHVPDFERLTTLRLTKADLTEAENVELELLESETKRIRDLFGISKNFVTTMLDPKSKNKTPSFISVTDEATLLQRAKTLSELATLIHQIISLQCLSSYMIKSTKQLGEIYVKNPQHFRMVFNTLEQITTSINNNIEAIRKKFSAIQQSSLNYMQLLEKELFPEEVKAILDSTSASIAKLSLRISAYRNKVDKNPDGSEPTVESVRNEMFSIAEAIAKMYHIIPKYLENSETEPAVATTPAPVPTRVSMPVLPIDDNYIKLIQLNKMLASIYERILTIQKNELPTTNNKNELRNHHAEIAAYKRLRKKLILLQLKSDSLINEENKSAERLEKANKTLRLSMDLCKQTLEFMLQPRHERLNSAADFSRKIHSDLASSVFLDEHQSKFWKKIYSFCHISIFAPDSRIKATKIDKACDKLVKSLTY